jgi:alpha-L-fucosidase
MFVHFGPNTFTDVEWGNGKEDPKIFNPTDLDCRQWAATAKAAGMKAIIITAKHHDGFCLWQSNYSTHTVRESAWKEGKGDVLKELSEACKEFGLKFGVYLSPWDQNHPTYGTPEYNQTFANTLTEVLGSYGHVFEQWFDGACGEGNNGKRQIYDWSLFNKTVYDLQPHAMIFSDVGPGCRWMGNESGVAGETNWSTLNTKGFAPGADAPDTKILNSGDVNGENWIPAETDVSIRPGWFYSPATDDKVKSLGHLVDIYYTSIGRNSNLLLNVPPDRRGQIHPNDSTRLMEFRKIIDETFSRNLLNDALVTSSNVRNKSKKYQPENLTDEKYDSYWATDDSVTEATLSFELKGEKTFNRLMLQEYIPLGQRVKSFSVEYWNGKEWEFLARRTTIGYKRILCFPIITTNKLRVKIDALACPVLNKIGLYKAPEILETPVISRGRNGMVRISCKSADPVIHYTTDGNEPDAKSPVYKEPFELYSGGTVKVKAYIENGTKSGETLTADYDIAKGKWSVLGESEEIKAGRMERAIDDNENTAGSASSSQDGKNQYLAIDLGETLTLKGFYYIPVAKNAACNIAKYNFLTSADGKKWTAVVNNATFGNIKNNPVRQDVRFDKEVKTRYIKLECAESTCGNKDVTIAELGVLTK